MCHLVILHGLMSGNTSVRRRVRDEFCFPHADCPLDAMAPCNHVAILRFPYYDLVAKFEVGISRVLEVRALQQTLNFGVNFVTLCKSNLNTHGVMNRRGLQPATRFTTLEAKSQVHT